MPRGFLTIVGLGLITGALCSSPTSDPARRTESPTTGGKREKSKTTASHPVAQHGTGHASSRIAKSHNSNFFVPPPPAYTPSFAEANYPSAYSNDSGNTNPNSNVYDSSSQGNARTGRSRAHSMQSSSEKARRVKRFAGTSFDEQLQVIADSGIKLANDRVDKIRSIVAEDKELYDEDPILFLLNVIASKDDEGTQYSSNICLFDAECIYKDGDYKAIVDDLAAICEGQMPVQHTEDSVDFSEDNEGGRGKTHVQFDLDGKSHKFKLKVDEDRVDPSIFDKIGTLFSKRTKGAKALWCLNFGGHIFGAICLSPDQAKVFQNQTLLSLQVFGKGSR
jgi:hypothetical protein